MALGLFFIWFGTFFFWLDKNENFWNNVNGAPMESGNMVGQQYPEAASLRSSSSFLHPPHNVQHHSFHHPTPPVQGVRNHNTNVVHPQVAAASYRVPSSYYAHNTMNLSQDGLEMVPRHMGHVPPTGFRIYRSPREGHVSETTLRQQNLPHLRVFPSDVILSLYYCDFCFFVSHRWCIIWKDIFFFRFVNHVLVYGLFSWLICYCL